MIRIIFENGGIAEFNNVEKIYIEEKEHDDKVTIVDKIVPIGYADELLEKARLIKLKCKEEDDLK